MESFLPFLALLWLLPAVIAAVGLRWGMRPWALGLLAGSIVTEVLAVAGAPVAVQLPVFTFGTLAVLIFTDVRQFFARREAEYAAASNRMPLARYLARHPELYARMGMQPPKANSQKKTDAPKGAQNGAPTTAPNTAPASPLSERASDTHDRARKDVQSRRRAAGQSKARVSRNWLRSHTGFRSRVEDVLAAEEITPERPRTLVEVITPSERAILRREVDNKGFWAADAARGEIQVFIPPGMRAYPGRAITVVTKPNGTRMGV